jgi:Zn finger protein HypA/HybF involved in hydrogenase expression
MLYRKEGLKIKCPKCGSENVSIEMVHLNRA